jgi:uncharacterized circularly permuted ATP-grasp superfamily protein/uncharacterized alpha-E superfamily protein
MTPDVDGLPLLEPYSARVKDAPTYDEFARLDATPDGRALRAGIDALGHTGLLTRRRDVRRMVLDDGVTYGAPDGSQVPWQVDPLPILIDAAEWQSLEAGLAQRARLLDALLTDLLTERRTLRERLLPAELVVGHPGFLVPAARVLLPGSRQLPMVSADLARTADGSWAVISDRTQSPSGAGYAMATRRIVSRALDHIYRGLPLRRLRPFFDVMRLGLLQSAPPTDDVPQVVLLTPGPQNETAYDQALLSTLLGHPLAQADDLLMRDGRLWLRTTGRLHHVDIVQRRVDAEWCDALDLRGDSRLGVPGLVAAAARSTVSVVNPFTAGVLENPGLFPYLPGIARALLGEDLKLPSPDTWWCGDPVGLDHVLTHLGELVVKPISRGVETAPYVGAELDSAGVESLRARITAEPWRWAGQEPVLPSSAPVVTPTGLTSRSLVLRTFGVAYDGSYHFLPGGMARVAGPQDSLVVTNRGGALAKDVWVVEAETLAPPMVLSATPTRLRRHPTVLPRLTPRGAGSLYWTGRYSERAQTTARLLNVVENLVEDNLTRGGTPGHTATVAMLVALTEVTTVRPGFAAGDPGFEARRANPLPLLRDLLLDPRLSGSLAYNARRMTSAAQEVREVLSLDTFGILNRLSTLLSDARAQGDDLHIQDVASHAMEACLALSGLASESLIRDPIWAFLEAGRRMERAQVTVRLLRNTLAAERSPIAEALVTEAVLRVGDSLITYRRRMAAGVGSGIPAGEAVHLLLTDETNPRSVVWSLRRLLESLSESPDADVDAAIQAVIARLETCQPDDSFLSSRVGLFDVMADLESDLRSLSDLIERTHFELQPMSRTYSMSEGVARR